MTTRRRGGNRIIVAVTLGVALAAAGCDTTAVNFVVTDGGRSQVAGHGDAAGTDLFDGTPADVVATDAAATRVTDIDAQVQEAGDGFQGVALATGPARYVQYKCCGADGGTCLISVQGDDASCRDTGTWVTYATTDCENQGLVVNGIGLYVGC